MSNDSPIVVVLTIICLSVYLGRRFKKRGEDDRLDLLGATRSEGYSLCVGVAK